VGPACTAYGDVLLLVALLAVLTGAVQQVVLMHSAVSVLHVLYDS
jgi:hypothetical protein